MMTVQYLPISWNQYHSLAQKIAAAILDSRLHADEIVAISRGGLTFGHMLSDLLAVPISTITIQSYEDIQSQGEVKITAKLQKSVKGKRILLVDDVSDSGKTLKRAVSYLRRLGPKEIITAAMYHKPRSIFRPDFFADETSAWIIFPYELTETIMSVTKQMTEEGKTKAEVQTFLESLGYKAADIAFVRKHYLT